MMPELLSPTRRQALHTHAQATRADPYAHPAEKAEAADVLGLLAVLERAEAHALDRAIEAISGAIGDPGLKVPTRLLWRGAYVACMQALEAEFGTAPPWKTEAEYAAEMAEFRRVHGEVVVAGDRTRAAEAERDRLHAALTALLDCLRVVTDRHGEYATMSAPASETAAAYRAARRALEGKGASDA
jgi:hypothetical protein